jgi:hypothetical protein
VVQDHGRVAVLPFSGYYQGISVTVGNKESTTRVVKSEEEKEFFSDKGRFIT